MTQILPSWRAAAAIAALGLLPFGPAFADCSNLRPPGLPGFFPEGGAGVQAGSMGEVARANTQTCNQVTIAGTFPGTADDFSAAAQASPTVLHTRAFSQGTDFVQAGAVGVLNFKVGGSGAKLHFDVAADGILGGIFGGNGQPGAGRFDLSASSSSTGTDLTLVESYTDTNGVSRASTRGSSNGPSTIATLGIAFSDFFAAGDNFFRVTMSVGADPRSFSDFSNTSFISGITVLTPGATLELPEGLFTLDPMQPNHYILSALLPVPEPAPALLWMLGGFVLYALRSRTRRISLP